MFKKISTLFLLIFLLGVTPALAFSIPGDSLLGHFLSNDVDSAEEIDAPQGVVPTPIPGAIWLLGTGLVGLVGLRRKYRS